MAGYETVDFNVDLVDGSYHEVDSSEMAFKIAGSMAFKDGVSKAKPVLLEPIMSVEVQAPEDYLGTILGSVTARRGNIKTTEEAQRRSGSRRRRTACRDVWLCY